MTAPVETLPALFDTYQVEGTTFRFPALPRATKKRKEMQTHRDRVLTGARKPQRWRTGQSRARRIPPGDGTFTPRAGEPGSTVTVRVCVIDGGRRFTREREGMVMFPAPLPRERWVSLWDGRMPVLVSLDADHVAGRLCGSFTLAEFNDRFPPADAPESTTEREETIMATTAKTTTRKPVTSRKAPVKAAPRVATVSPIRKAAPACTDHRCVQGVTACHGCRGQGRLKANGRTYRYATPPENIGANAVKHAECKGTGRAECGCVALSESKRKRIGPRQQRLAA